MNRIAALELLAAVVLGSLVGVRPAPAQQEQELMQRFMDEAPKRWEEYERFATQLQGTVRYAYVRSVLDENAPQYEDKVQYTVKQNARCALVGGQHPSVKGSNDDPIEYLFFTNPKYTAHLRRNLQVKGDYLLKEFSEVPNTVPSRAPRPIKAWAVVSLSPQFSFHDSLLSERIRDGSLRVKNIKQESGGDATLIRADFECVLGPPKYKPVIMVGSMLLEPSKAWSIREIGERLPTTEPETEIRTLYETADHPSGFPLIRRESRSNQIIFNQKKVRNQYEIDYDIRVDERIPDSEFTLSAFGLPEPAGVIWERPTPYYIWILAAAAGCGALALLFRYLARRRPSGAPS
jgi:hypothetical protein